MEEKFPENSWAKNVLISLSLRVAGFGLPGLKGLEKTYLCAKF
jgi:hypothetical protein